ncbi:MAG: Ig-like domain-containing protein, partial [Clostridia bacterium]|nr:Ig-like domain-containing protein [Clostridia bacterium]
MKNSVRKLFCAALALLLIFGAVEVPYLPADEQAADESLLAILGLADPDAAGHAAYAEEVPPESDSDNAAPTDEASPEAEAADESADEKPAPEATGDPESTATPNPTDGAPSDPDEGDVPGDPQNSASPDDVTDEEITENVVQLSQGYARIASGSSVRVASDISASELAVLDAGTVYVAEINETDNTAKICFAHEKLAYVAWANAADLTPLTADELDALRIPSDAPTYSGHALPEPGARFMLQLSIEACPELSPGDQVKLAAAYSDSKVYPIEWSSSDPSVAEISTDGMLTAVSPGTATITASGICMPASIQIAVSEPESISLSATTLTIGAGETVTDGLVCTVTPEHLLGELRWSSSNTRYVKVDKASGAITGVRTGSATVTVSTPSGLRASCKVTVRSAPRSVKLSAGATMLGVGNSAVLSVSFNSGAYSYGIRYAVSDESVLRVEDGRVYAVAPGSATVTAKTFNNKTASLNVTVVPAPESVAFNSDAAILGMGQTHVLSAAVNPESASA